MLSINVALCEVILVGFVVRGIKEEVKNCSVKIVNENSFNYNFYICFKVFTNIILQLF
jgi:hypothetical protein